MKNIINLNWLRSLVYYVQMSNQIPSILKINNIYLTIIIIIGILSSIIVRCADVDLILAPSLTFLWYLILLFSIVFIFYIQYTLIFRVGHIIKNIPHYIKLIKKRDVLNIKIISSYFIINIISGFISLWIITRMISMSNYGDLYLLSLVVGLFLSLYLFYKYNKNITELNYNIRRYPLWMISIVGSIIIIFWLLIPISIVNMLDKYTMLLEKYNIYLSNSIKMSMNSDSDNVSSTVRSNIQNPESIMEREIPKGVSRSVSTTNSITNTADTSTNTEAGDGGVAKAISTASLSNKNDVSPNQDSLSIQETNPLSTNPFLDSEETPLVFARPEISDSDSYLTQNYFTDSNNKPKSSKLSKLFIISGKCESFISSELSFSSKFTYLNESKIPYKAINYYFNKYPGLPKMSKVSGLNFYQHVFYMDLSPVDLYTILNISEEYINKGFPENLSVITLYKLTNSNQEVTSLLKCPGFLEKWYYFNNILERLIASDEYGKFVSQEDSLTILRKINKKHNSAAELLITWFKDIENVGNCKINFTDLEIKLFYDLGFIKNFLFKDIDQVVSLDYFLRLKNNMILRDLIDNYFINYTENDDNLILDGDYRKYYYSILLDKLKIDPYILIANKDRLTNLYHNFEGNYNYGCRSLINSDYEIYKAKMELENSFSLHTTIRKGKSMAQLNIPNSQYSNKVKTLKKAISSIFIKK